MPRRVKLPGLFFSGNTACCAGNGCSLYCAVLPQETGEKMESKTQKSILLNGTALSYELERKKVKNINLRVKPDGTVHVSASRWHSMRSIEALLYANADKILAALEKFRQAREKAASFERLSRAKERELCEKRILALCRTYYPAFSQFCGSMPEIKYRKMKSRWGSCAPQTGVLTFNTALAYVPERCAEYVVVHEFSHFVQANHSKAFYEVVSSLLPDWKQRRAELRNYESILC